MHLKSIPEVYARAIKGRAASLGMSPSQYFVHLHLKDLAEPLPGQAFAEQGPDQNRSQSQNQSKKKKKRR